MFKNVIISKEICRVDLEYALLDFLRVIMYRSRKS